MPDFYILLSLLSIFMAWKWGDWRNWKLYYPTILYMIFGNLIYIIATNDKPLWQYESAIFNSNFVEFLIAFVVFPCSCLVFLSLYSKVIKSKKIYIIIFWIFLSISVEWLSVRLGFFSYHNGWNLCWSFGFDCIMYPLLILHYKRSLWFLVVTIILSFLIMNLFNLSFAIIKIK